MRTFVIPFFYDSGSAKAKSHGFGSATLLRLPIRFLGKVAGMLHSLTTERENGFLCSTFFKIILHKKDVLAKVATALGSIPASANIVESEGRLMKQCGIK
jgi:hypothetical protein